MSVRLKHVAGLVTACDESGVARYVALEHVDGGTGRLVADAELAEVPAPSTGTASARRGDVLFGKLRPYLAKTWLVDRPVFASTELLCLRPRADVDSRWLAYTLASRPLLDWAVATSDGAKMPRTSWEKLAEFRLAVPSLARQREIADYLDAETARIDALIAKKQQLIALLRDRQKALTATAVMRESEVQDAGKVLRRVALRRITRFAYGDSLAADEREEGGVPVYGSNGPVGIHDRANTKGPVIIVGRKGSFGKVHFSDQAVFAIDTTFYVDRTQTDADLRWLYYVLSDLGLDSLTDDVGVPGLSRDKAYEQRVPLPSLALQQALANRLDVETARTATLVDRLNKQVELLRELRRAVITSAVGGEVAA